MPALTPTQRDFLLLHRDCFVTEWRQTMFGGMLRASTQCRQAISIAVRELDQLVALGLMTASHCNCWEVTEAGKAAV